MGKLFGLKGWLPVAEAARHLATVIKEAVSEADVLRLVLDGQLRLSVYFVNSTIARTGRVIAIDKATGEPAWPTEVIRGLTLNTGEGIVFDGDVVPVTGVWDLPMIDGETIHVEQRYQHLIDGPAVTRIAFNGTFVEGKDGQICQLQEDGDENEFLHPAGGLPKDTLLVVRTEVLREFEEVAIAEQNKANAHAPEESQKALAATERHASRRERTLAAVVATIASADQSLYRNAEKINATKLAQLVEDNRAKYQKEGDKILTQDEIVKLLRKILNGKYFS